MTGFLLIIGSGEWMAIVQQLGGRIQGAVLVIGERVTRCACIMQMVI